MAVIKIKTYAEATSNHILTYVMRPAGFVATIIYDESSIKVVAKDKEIETRLLDLINSPPEWAKETYPLPLGELTKDKALIAAQNIMLYPHIERIKVTSDEVFFIDRTGFWVLYKKSPQSKIEAMITTGSDCKFFFDDLVGTSGRIWNLLLSEEQNIWRKLNGEYPGQKKKEDYECQGKIIKYFFYDTFKYWLKNGYKKSASTDFQYDFSIAVLLAEKSYGIHPDKEAFFQRILNRIWDED